MSRVRTFLKKHPLWLGFVVAVVPLVVLLGLQYLWLARLQETSAVAHTAYLGNYLEAVTRRVEYHYRSMAERSLNIPAPILEALDRDEMAKYFKKKPIKGAKEVFVLYYENGKAKLVFYDRFLRTMVSKPDSPHLKFIGAATTPLIVLRFEQSQIASTSLTVHERDPNTRIIINPIVDDDARLVGVAGVVVDPEHFRSHVLPDEVEKAFKDFPGSEQEVIVTVRDSAGELIYSSAELEDGAREDDAQQAVPFIFSDYSVGIRSRGLTPEQWANVSFGVNMTMALLLALVVAVGLALAFRSANRELKLSEMKATFVSNVSHELRTPLASIRVFGEFLRLGRVRSAGKVSEYGEYIETESRRLTQLINNILDFSKIESEVKTYDFEPADVEAIATDTLRTFDVRLKHTGFEIEFSKPEQPLPLAAVDRDAVRQAINNLLDNAVKYSGDSRRIGVKLGTRDDFVTIAVRDYGIGISQDEQKKIFDRFHRVSTGLVHDVKGSGLGLSIVSHVVNAHGGKVRVKSEPGKGSIFTLYLPVASADDTTQRGPEAEGGPGRESERREVG